MRTIKFEIVQIGVEEGVDPSSGIEDSLLLHPVLQEGTLLSFNVV
jgi:hypothetical protein